MHKSGGVTLERLLQCLTLWKNEDKWWMQRGLECLYSAHTLSELLYAPTWTHFSVKSGVMANSYCFATWTSAHFFVPSWVTCLQLQTSLRCEPWSVTCLFSLPPPCQQMLTTVSLSLVKMEALVSTRLIHSSACACPATEETRVRKVREWILCAHTHTHTDKGHTTELSEEDYHALHYWIV